MSPSSTITRTRAALSALALAFACTQCVTQVSGKFVDPMQQGFLFDWSGDQSPPNPTAAQCQLLHITWGRRSANGPNPAAPYFLQIYTSTFITPFVIPAGSGQSFDWPVPFVPGTQFQICMFASNNVTGGCQQVSTVYQAPNTTLADPPTCQNLTYYQPDQVLGVDATLPDGSWSTYGWVNQCSDISIKPTNGTPPYTYTISPALRPPYNFTSDNKDPVDWTVTLAYGLPFWLTVADSSGMAWTQGPLHASGGSTTCLSAGSSSSDSSDGLSTGAAVGVAFGGLIVGLLAGAIGAILFLRRKSVRYQQVNSLHLRHKSSESPLDLGLGFADPSSSASSTFPRNRSSPHDIDPYVLPAGGNTSPFNPYASFQDSQQSPQSTSDRLAMPSTSTSPSPQHEHAHSRSYTTTTSNVPTVGGASPTAMNPNANSISSNTNANIPPRSPISGFGPAPSGNQHVYVVHHDGGRPPPVTVFTSDGTEVVELPPQYENAAEERRREEDERRRARGGGGVQGPDHRRRPGGMPVKQGRRSQGASS